MACGGAGAAGCAQTLAGAAAVGGLAVGTAASSALLGVAAAGASVYELPADRATERDVAAAPAGSPMSKSMKKRLNCERICSSIALRVWSAIFSILPAHPKLN